MKICFLANAKSIHSKKWIEYFANKNHEIHWISLTPNPFGEIKGVNFYLGKNFSAKFLNIPLNIAGVKKILKRINPDILHAHSAGVGGGLGAFSGFHPFIVTAYGSEVLIFSKSWLVKTLVSFVLKKADLITCDAEHTKKAMTDLGAEPSKIKIINFGVDTKKFIPGEKDNELQEKLGISNSPVVISLRNIDPVYDIESLIKAIPLVLKKFATAKFIITGAGSRKEYLKDLKKLSEDLGISKAIRFVGWIEENDVAKYLRTSDIYVSTSLSDAGIASSTAEAMACSLPVVITDFGENKKWVKDGESGFLIPLKNPAILAEKIIYLIKNKELGIKIGRRARRVIEERNDYYKEMEKVEKIYYQLAGEK